MNRFEGEMLLMNHFPTRSSAYGTASNRVWSGAVISILLLLTIALSAPSTHAFWLLGFSTADTLAPGHVGFIAGTGGQFADVGHPKQTSFTPFLAHAGIRLGLFDRIDIGYRLTQVAIPFSSAGATLGGEADIKYRLTDPSDSWQVAMLAGGAYGYVNIQGQSREAWSPGVDLIASHIINPRLWLITELRYVYTAIPTAPGGTSANYVHAVGPDLGFKVGLTPQVSLIPEMGLFDFTGRFKGKDASGMGYQYGVVLAVANLPGL